MTKIFPNAITAKDGQTIELDFEEENQTAFQIREQSGKDDKDEKTK